MNLFEMTKELRKGVPDRKKAIKKMYTLGALLTLAAAANFLISQFTQNTDFDRIWFKTILAACFIAGLFLLAAGYGIKENSGWGEKAGQIGLVICIIVSCITPILMFTTFDESSDDFMKIPFTIFGFIVMLQFIVPAAYGIRYLQRLKQASSDPATYNPPKLQTSEMRQEIFGEHANYHYSPLRLDPGVLLFIMIFLIIGLTFLIQKFGSGSLLISSFIPIVFLIAFSSPVIFNKMPSPFQESRELIQSFTGGGSIGALQGTMPFFRLLLYHDGLEVRVFFNSYFIPYKSLKNVKAEKNFFSNSIQLHSDIPGVPSNIVFACSSIDYITEIIQNCTDPSKPGTENPVVKRAILNEPKTHISLSKEDLKYDKKILVALSIIEILFILLAGPIIINCQKLSHAFIKMDSAVFEPDQYRPVDAAKAPQKYGLVVVKYDDHREVVMEKYFTRLGEVTTLAVENGQCINRGTWFFSTVFIGIFAFSGMCLLALGSIIYRPLTAYGIALLAIAFVFGAIKSFLIDFMLGSIN